MKNKRKIPNEKYNAKRCAYCNGIMYARKDSALYCSDTCKKQFNLEKNKNQKWYSHDPNKGIRLPLGTITSWEMPEDTLVFSGELASFYCKLAAYVTPEQFSKEKVYIENLEPFSETTEWTESSVQIFTDKDFIEVFRISPGIYKLYVDPWGEENEKPFV